MLHEQDDCRIPLNITWGIFFISVLGLFLEMLLIRWISSEIRIFAYLQNTVLVVCFLGLGLGCFTSRQPILLRKTLYSLFLLTLFFAIPLTRESLGNISLCLSVLEDMVIWSNAISTSLWQTLLFLILGLFGTFAIMMVILNIFVPIGRLLGRLMDSHPKIIWAYSVNVAGSLVGSWLFVLLSMSYQPPLAWFAVMASLFLFFLGKPDRNKTLNIGLLIGIIVFSWFAGKEKDAIEVIWSPYQKLVVQNVRDRGEEKMGAIASSFVITVNNTFYQDMVDLNKAKTSPKSNRLPPELLGFSQYDIPLLLHPKPKKMLVVGAGSGNDAAGGIRNNVEQITAVEIDPAILSLGERYHPEKPYTNPAVKIVNDDARSFFAKCKDKYDVISFGFLDAHTTTSMTNARLDHYVYTKEAIDRAKALLAPGGVMTLSFCVTRPFIADRMAGVLRDVFQSPPIMFWIPVTNLEGSRLSGNLMLVTGNLTVAQTQIQKNPPLESLITQWQKEFPVSLPYATKIATDDWPYIYLKSPKIPILYYLLAGLMVLLFLLSAKQWHAPGIFLNWNLSHWHFFFLGAAFLLLEVQNISKAAVVLGNTWEVNAVIISGVLIMILFANFVAYRFPGLSINLVYLCLIGTCLGLYLVDLASFAFLPYAPKAVLVGGLTTLPMLFSGIVFIRSFAVVAGKDEALGANLIGALVGALLQSVTFITGIKALLLIVAALYLASLLTRPILSPKEA